jgi:trigger factor
MTETTTTVSPLEKTISLTLSVERINVEVEKRLQKAARTARLPGFRPGKVPMKMVVQHYGHQVHSEVLQDEIGRTFNEEVEKQDLRVAGSPRIEATEGSAEEALEFKAIFEVFPEVKLGDFSVLEIEKTVVEVSDAEVDKTLDILRKQRATFAEVDRAAQDEDKVTLDFCGKIDDVAFPGGTAEDFPFVLGKGQMLPEFEAAAKGLKTGETKGFPLSFPEDYHGKDVAGKTAQFDITIKKVEAPQLPELNDEFARMMGIEEGDIAKLREDVRVNLSREVSNRTKIRTKNAVMDALLKVADFAVPNALVKSETTEMATRARQDLKSRGMKDVEKMQLPEDLFVAQAERRVRLGLIVSDLVKQNNLRAKPEQVRAFIEEQAQSYENPAEVMQWYFQDSARLADVEAVILEDNVVEFTLSKSKVIEKKLSFDELMGNN